MERNISISRHPVSASSSSSTLYAHHASLGPTAVAARCCCCCCCCVLYRSGSLGASLCFAVPSISRRTIGVVGNEKNTNTPTHISVGGGILLGSPIVALKQHDGFLLLLTILRIRRPWATAAATVATLLLVRVLSRRQIVCMLLLFVLLSSHDNSKQKRKKSRWIFAPMSTN